MHPRATEEFDLWTVYDHPSDYPIGFVARRFTLAGATDQCLTAPTLEQLRDAIAVADQIEGRGLRACLARHQRDDAKIVEVWI